MKHEQHKSKFLNQSQTYYFTF